MAQVANWYGRKFDFSFPAELYPNVCARLRGTPARLDELLLEAPRGMLMRKCDQKWSAQEHAGHLLDLEPLWLARVENFIASAPELAVTDLSNRQTDAANYNERQVNDVLNNFRQARLRLLNRVWDLKAEDFSRSAIHPRLKQPMRLVDHLYFVAEHDDHHLASVWELLNAR